MPIYAYKCQHCGHELEALQKLSDEPLTDCSACHQPELKKQITAAAFRLSGSGWYETDFKKDNRKNLAGDGATDSGKKDGDKKDGDKKDSKPASDSKPADSKAADKPKPAPAAD